jgi:hypothetical protein
MQRVSISTASSMNVQDESLSTTGSMDVQGVCISFTYVKFLKCQTLCHPVSPVPDENATAGTSPILKKGDPIRCQSLIPDSRMRMPTTFASMLMPSYGS